MHEFDLIAHYFKPLSGERADALGLADDAAVMLVPEGMELVLTKDVMQQGIHFFGDEAPRLIAKKLLRTNLSDLAAMGAKPYGYLLGLGLPAHIGPNWLADFAAGLREDNVAYGVHVLGGDTTRTQAYISLSLTALGYVPKGQALRRGGAQVGDKVYVSGTLGDAALGLRVMRGALLGLSEAHQAYLRERYLLPCPRVELGVRLRGVAHAAMDISDGLLQDAGHIAKASSVGMVLQRDLLPLSDAARGAILPETADFWQCIVAGGDDYELLMTLPANAPVPEGLTHIGDVVAGEGVVLLDAQAHDVTPQQRGYSHF
jgi:thiamine-monophosphate kinase